MSPLNNNKIDVSNSNKKKQGDKHYYWGVAFSTVKDLCFDVQKNEGWNKQKKPSQKFDLFKTIKKLGKFFTPIY